MSIFSKRNKNSDFFELLEESLQEETDNITLENAPIHNAPYAITAKEVLSPVGNNVEDTVAPSSSPLEALKLRMKSVSGEPEKQTDISTAVEIEKEPEPELSLLEKCKA